MKHKLIAGCLGLVFGLIVACWTLILPHRALGVTFGGSGWFISRNTCTDITSPVSGQSVCWDVTNTVLKYWNGSAWTPAVTAWLMANVPVESPLAVTSYMVISGSQVAEGFEYNVQMPAPSAGVIVAIQCELPNAPTSGKSWTFTLRKNASSTALLCAIANSATTCSASGAISIAAGDLLDTYAVAAGSPASTYAACSYALQ
jgi:hypothetical protein